MKSKTFTKDLTKNEIILLLNRYYDSNDHHSTQKIIWLYKNEKDYLLNALYSYFPEIDKSLPFEEFLYRIKYPNPNLICPVCKRKYDSFKLSKGYYGGYQHINCNKTWVKYIATTYVDMCGNDDLKNKSTILHLCERDDIILLLKDFISKFPKISTYSYIEILYYLVYSKKWDTSDIPLCKYCDQFRRPYIGSGCDCDTELSYLDYCNNKQCMYKCRIEKSQTTCMNRYGVKNPSEFNEFKEKREKTLLQNYGVPNIMLCEEGVKKQKQAILEKFGVESVTQLQEFKDKVKKTVLSKYSTYENFVDCTIGGYLKDNNIHNSMDLQVNRDKLKNTLLSKYGTLNMLDVPEFKKKYIQTIMSKYGVDNVFKSDQIKDKIRQYYMLRYGVSDNMKVPEIVQKISDSQRKRIENLKNCGVTYGYATMGLMEFDVLNKIQTLLDKTIYRQVCISDNRYCYVVDGYIPQYNIVIEYDEKFHDEDDVKQLDEIRYNQICEYLIDCKFLRLRYDDNMDNFILKLKNEIDNRNNYVSKLNFYTTETGRCIVKRKESKIEN